MKRTAVARTLAPFACLGFAACSDGGSGDLEVLSDRQLAVISGTTDTESNSVGFVEVTTPSGSAVCTATLITEHLLLTAAHCLTGQFGPLDCDVDTVHSPMSPESFRISFEPDLAGTPDASWVFPDVAAVHLLAEGEPLCGNDIGLLELDEPHAGSPPVAISTISVEPNRPYAAIGYGAAHPSGTGERVRRSRSRVVSCAGAAQCEGAEVEGLAGGPGVTAPSIAESEFIGTPGACPGDSGGPALVGEGGVAAVMGVLSRGRADCGLNIYSMVDFASLQETVTALTGEELSLHPAISEPTLNEGGAGGSGGTAFEEGEAREGIVRATPLPDDSGCGCKTSSSISRSQSHFLWGAIVLGAFLVRRKRRTV